MGEGRHVSFTLAAGGARSRCVAFGRGSSLPAAPGEPVDAAVKLEINRYNGAVEPRLVLRHAQPAGRRRSASSASRSRGGAARRVVADLDDDGFARPPGSRTTCAAPPTASARRRPARSATCAAAASPVCSATSSPAARPCSPSRPTPSTARRALRDRVGGFDVTTWAALAADPGLAAAYPHVVAVDPPARAAWQALAGSLPGEGWVHFAWGEAERELAARVLTWELDLRAPLAEAYRALRAAAAAARPPRATPTCSVPGSASWRARRCSPRWRAPAPSRAAAPPPGGCCASWRSSSSS